MHSILLIYWFKDIFLPMSLTELSEAALQVEIGVRLRGVSLRENITQEELADSVGLSRRTVANAEKVTGCTLNTLLVILRGLGHLDGRVLVTSTDVEVLLPAPVHSPVQLVREGGVPRQRVRRKSSDDKVSGWRWGDE